MMLNGQLIVVVPSLGRGVVGEGQVPGSATTEAPRTATLTGLDH